MLQTFITFHVYLQNNVKEVFDVQDENVNRENIEGDGEGEFYLCDGICFYVDQVRRNS